MKTIKPTKTWAVVALAVCLIAFVALGVSTIVKHNNKLQFQKVELQDTSAKLKLLQQQYDVQLKNKNVDEKKLKELEQQKQDLEKQLAAKQEAKRVADAQAAEAQQAAARLANVVTQTKTAYAAPAGGTTNCGSSWAQQQVYSHESGCFSGQWNTIGCYGLGQDCNHIVYNQCGADWGCQNDYFTGYMQRRYGSWEAAWVFWQRTDCRPYCGHWW